MNGPHLYTIPSAHNFLKDLASGLLSYGLEHDIPLPSMRVMLPTRRAVRGLRDAFISQHGNKPILLPRIHPLGDVDPEELDFTLSNFGLDVSNIPPAISGFERQFILAKLISAKDVKIGYAQSLILAKNLATLLDQSHTENLNLSGLKGVVPQSDFAEHWQNILKFLDIISEIWPKILFERGQIDPAHRRALLMKELGKIWDDQPPQTPIIAAGSTGSIPTTANLLNIVAHLPLGIVVLPGLDLELDKKSWQHLDDTHPQRTMRNLLDSFQLDRDAVKVWPASIVTASKDPLKYTERRQLIRAMMLPAETFGNQSINQKTTAQQLNTIQICEAVNSREEAQIIATKIRLELENPNQTICLITPDRQLAARVTTALKRWKIEADDSAGICLSETCSGQFFLNAISLLTEDFSALALLQLIKHPLSTFKDLKIDNFEKLVLRGSAPDKGWKGISRRSHEYFDTHEDIKDLVTTLGAYFDPIIEFTQGAHPPLQMLQKILEQCENMGGGPQDFWAAEESDALSSFFSKLLIECQNLAPMDIYELADIVRVMLNQEVHRNIQPRNQRIVILGQMESRLIQHDVMILSGLNEGTWPAEPSHDPWMSRQMRRNFGLSPAARTIGLAAHDFTEAMAAPKVILTRSIKSDGTETVPSRWLQRLSTLIKSSAISQDWTDNTIIRWTRELDRAKSAYFKPLPPAPCPPVSTRPQQLSVTAIEKWIKNPYHIYAQKILRLKRVKSLDEDEIFSERGTFIHAVLEKFITQTFDHFPVRSEAISMFKEIAKLHLLALETISPNWHYWWPKIDRLANWVVETEEHWRGVARPHYLEKTGSLLIHQNLDSAPARSFTLTAKADRIDRFRAHGYAILDYKTGGIPTLKSITNGQCPQLALEALILKKNGYDMADSSSKPEAHKVVTDLIYWRVAAEGDTVSLAEKFGPDNIDELITQAELGLKELVALYESSLTPYIALPLQGRIYEDDRAYAHLARMGEWAILGGENSDDSEYDADGGADITTSSSTGN